jgi:hypothetical protein
MTSHLGESNPRSDEIILYVDGGLILWYHDHSANPNPFSESRSVITVLDRCLTCCWDSEKGLGLAEWSWYHNISPPSTKYYLIRSWVRFPQMAGHHSLRVLKCKPGLGKRARGTFMLCPSESISSLELLCASTEHYRSRSRPGGCSGGMRTSVSSGLRSVRAYFM